MKNEDCFRVQSNCRVLGFKREKSSLSDRFPDKVFAGATGLEKYVVYASYGARTRDMMVCCVEDFFVAVAKSMPLLSLFDNETAN